jgi:hypothetical protein
MFLPFYLIAMIMMFCFRIAWFMFAILIFTLLFVLSLGRIRPRIVFWF